LRESEMIPALKCLGYETAMKIFLKGMRLQCAIGLTARERAMRPVTVIDVEIEYDGTGAARDDDPEQAVNYRVFAENISRVASASEFKLVEALARRVAQECFRDSRVQAATVSVTKPGAVTNVREAGVTHRFVREDMG